MDPELKSVEYVPRNDYMIKLYTSDDIKRCRAILLRGLTAEEAEAKYEEINRALGHTETDVDGDLIVLASNGPYVLID